MGDGREFRGAVGKTREYGVEASNWHPLFEGIGVFATGCAKKDNI